MLAMLKMLDKHSAVGTGTTRWRLNSNDIFHWGISQDFQPGVFATALLIPTLVYSRCFPLMEAIPAKVEPSALLFSADGTDESLVFHIQPLTQAVTAWTFLDPHSFAKVIFRDFGLKFLLLCYSKHSKTANIDIVPFLVAA